MHNLPLETTPHQVLDLMQSEAFDLCHLRNLPPYEMAPDGWRYWEHAARELAMLKSALHVLRQRGHMP